MIERVTFTLEHNIKHVEDLYEELNKCDPNGKKQEKNLNMEIKRKDIPQALVGASHILKSFTERMNFEIPFYEKLLSYAMEPYSNIFGISVESFHGNFNSIQHALVTMSSFRAGTVKANFKIKHYRTLIDGLLRDKREVERAWYKASESIDMLLLHIERGKQQATKVERYFSELI